MEIIAKDGVPESIHCYQKHNALEKTLTNLSLKNYKSS